MNITIQKATMSDFGAIEIGDYFSEPDSFKETPEVISMKIATIDIGGCGYNAVVIADRRDHRQAGVLLFYNEDSQVNHLYITNITIQFGAGKAFIPF